MYLVSLYISIHTPISRSTLHVSVLLWAKELKFRNNLKQNNFLQ